LDLFYLFSVFGVRGFKKGGPVFGIRGVGNRQKWQKVEKRPKKPPAKTPYDVKSALLIAVFTFLVCFSVFLGFREVFWGVFGFLKTSGLCP